ncbi:MAG TPA: Ig-like domain repeat protein [Solirubrobacteraceae bacterium]
MPWRSGRELACRFVVGVAAAVVGLAIAAEGASAAVYSVNTLADNPAASSECSGAPSDCSLRQALDKATPGDIITFGVTGTIMLSAPNGPLVVSSDVTIDGPGSRRLAVDGGGSIQILSALPPTALSISGLTFQNGQATSTGSSVAQGGAISYQGAGTLTLTDDAFVNDSAQGSSTGNLGGAVATDSNATLSVNASSFTRDSASTDADNSFASGGAIYASGPLNIDGSTFADNTVTLPSGEAEGGAVAGGVTIDNSTFTGNEATDSGGQCCGEGGALFAGGGTLTDDTFEGNVASTSGAAISGARGLIAYGTIISRNSLTFGVAAECDGGFANAASTTSYNLEGPTGHSCFQGPTVDPMLGPLADNGGPTQTEAITPSSAAYGGVPTSACREAPFLQVDQRGRPRPGSGKRNCDIGAYEYQVSSSGGSGGTPASTSATVSSSSNLSRAAQQVTFTATVSPVPDGGSVQFTDPGTTIPGCGAVPVNTSTGQATCTTAFNTPGSYPIQAIYSGDEAFGGSQSPVITQVVTRKPSAKPAHTSLRLRSSASSVWVGTQVTYTAHVTPDPNGGHVSFLDNGHVIAGCGKVPVNNKGTARCKWTYSRAAVHTIQAGYAGTARFANSAAKKLTETVKRKPKQHHPH